MDAMWPWLALVAVATSVFSVFQGIIDIIHYVKQGVRRVRGSDQEVRRVLHQPVQAPGRPEQQAVRCRRDAGEARGPLREGGHAARHEVELAVHDRRSRSGRPVLSADSSNATTQPLRRAR